MKQVSLVERIETKEIIGVFSDPLDAQLLSNDKNRTELRSNEIIVGLRNYRHFSIDVK